MDRLFLKGLVEEIEPRILRRRVRTAEADRSGTVVLSFDRRQALVFSFLSEAAGLYLGEPAGAGATRTPTPGLRKAVTGAVVTGLEAAELDRIVTLSLEQTRLSGRKEHFRIVLEVFATRANLYLVDGAQQGIVEVFSSGSHARLGAGEIYRSPAPPPTAAPPPSDGVELERRLAAPSRDRSGSRRSRLLAATGLTPLLVREIEWLVDVQGRTVREAFERVRAGLEAKHPVLYAAEDLLEPRGRSVLVSPLALESESELRVVPPPHAGPPSFSEVMAGAVELVRSGRRIRSTRGRLESALSKRLDKARRLRGKLLHERASLPVPDELRGRGERLLAALSRARRSSDGRRVVVPDLFDPEEPEIEIELDPRLSLPANAERWFARAKKANRAGTELAKRIDATDEEISFLESFECDTADARNEVELGALLDEAIEEGLIEPEPVKKGREPKARGGSGSGRLPPREFRSHRGNPILVGRSARSNEETTFRIAGPDDLWFHAAGAAGAHVVLRVAPGAVADEGEIEEAAGLAAYFSKRRNDTKVDVLVTERRHVAKIKGAPRGLVKVSSSRTVRVPPRLLSASDGSGIR